MLFAKETKQFLALVAEVRDLLSVIALGQAAMLAELQRQSPIMGKAKVKAKRTTKPLS